MADALVDFRMPAFAFISGWVYTLRPATWGALPAFLAGKLHRLVVPGLVAAVACWLLATCVVPDAIGAAAPLWRVLTLSYLIGLSAARRALSVAGVEDVPLLFLASLAGASCSRSPSTPPPRASRPCAGSCSG